MPRGSGGAQIQPPSPDPRPALDSSTRRAGPLTATSGRERRHHGSDYRQATCQRKSPRICARAQAAAFRRRRSAPNMRRFDPRPPDIVSRAQVLGQFVREIESWRDRGRPDNAMRWPRLGAEPCRPGRQSVAARRHRFRPRRATSQASSDEAGGCRSPVVEMKDSSDTSVQKVAGRER
jgi:hypothetical protein